MDRRRQSAVFCEDVAHERLLDALLRRVAGELRRPVEVRTVSGRGGHGRALAELRAFQRLATADLLVIGIDANCQVWNAARAEIEAAVDRRRFAAHAIACPDPHVERWYLSDPEGFRGAFGVSFAPERRKCDRDRYKQALRGALEQAGHLVTLGGAEFAHEIVAAMDLSRAARKEPSLKHFLEGLRSGLR